MRHRSIGFVPLGVVLLGTSLVYAIDVFSPPVTEEVLFGLLPYLVGSVAGGLCLALGTIEWAPADRWYLPLGWYPGWCLAGAGLVHAFFRSAGFSLLWMHVTVPILVGASFGGIHAAWRWWSERR